MAPLRALWLTALAASWLARWSPARVELELAQGKAVLRHGSLHATVGKSRVHSPPQVLGALGAIALGAAHRQPVDAGLRGAAPAVLCAAHAAVRKRRCSPSSRACAPSRLRPRAALSEEAAATDEMEEGTAQPPPRDEELARRVDAIRQSTAHPPAAAARAIEKG